MSDNPLCPHCGKIFYEANRVSIHGMYDAHLFQKVTGNSVDEIILNWVLEEDDVQYGPTSLCPAIVLCGKRELRRVGPMVHRRTDAAVLKQYREALLADPDIPRLLGLGTASERPE